VNARAEVWRPPDKEKAAQGGNLGSPQKPNPGGTGPTGRGKGPSGDCRGRRPARTVRQVAPSQIGNHKRGMCRGVRIA
jgi:hypothetical protein